MQVGDWVTVEGKIAMLDHLTGHISWAPMCKVIYAANNQEDHVLYHDMQPTESSLTSEDYQMLQLLAVDTNDQEWFEELGRHIKEEVR